MQAKRRPFGFPKWRSNDAMSASLVASGKVAQMIPKDSNIPEHRKQKLEETERKAEAEKLQLHQSVVPKRPLHKGKSLESLTMQLDYKPWYDRERIQRGVSRESIANMGMAKEKFEKEGKRRGVRRGQKVMQILLQITLTGRSLFIVNSGLNLTIVP